MAYKTIPNPDTWTQADWYVDWAAGNDKNDGKTALTAVKTVMGGVVARWGTPNPTLKQTTTFHILSSQPVGAEEIVMSPTLEAPANLVFIGTPSLVANFNLGAVTSKNRATNTQFSAAGFPGGTAVGQLVQNNQAGKNSRCFVRTIIAGTAQLSQPLVPLVEGVDTVFQPAPAEVDTWALNDTVALYSLPLLNLLNVSTTGGMGTTPVELTSALWIQLLRIPDPSGTPVTMTFQPSGAGTSMVITDTYIEPYWESFGTYVSFDNAYLDGGGEGDHVTFCGGIINQGFIFYHACIIDGDVIMDALCVPTGSMLLVGFVNVAVKLQANPTATMRINATLYTPTPPIVWGVGTIDVQPEGVLWNSTGHTWATTVFTTTLTINALNVATKYVAGVFTDGVAVNVANLDAFGGLQNPIKGGRYTS